MTIAREYPSATDRNPRPDIEVCASRAARLIPFHGELGGFGARGGLPMGSPRQGWASSRFANRFTWLQAAQRPPGMSI